VTNSTRNRLLLAGGLVVAVVGFLLFRPDTLFTDVPVDQSLEEAFTTTTTTNLTSSTAAPTTTTSGTATPPTTSQDVEPVEVTAGMFTGIDHNATGTVNVYEQDGRFVLRFEDDTNIQNGPDLYVWVLPAESYDGGIPGEYLDLGVLTGTVGSQNYQLPESFDPSVHRTVLIWCLRFAVPFGAAPLQ
jgi:Electron transfer DM13